MGTNDQLYATGCSVLFEGDVDRGWLEQDDAGGCPSMWRPGPLVFARRNTTSDRKEIDDSVRRRRLGHGIARHTIDSGRRYHRRVSYTVSTRSSTGTLREMTIVAFELILGDLSTAPVDAKGNDHRIPAIVVVHLDLPGNTSDSADATSALRFEHVGNLVATFFRWNVRDCCGLLERFLTAEGDSGLVVKDGGSFGLSAEGDVAPNPHATSGGVRLLASPGHESTAALPMYWILTDVAPQDQADVERWNSDVEYYEHGRGRRMGLKACIPAERRARRSRVLAELEVRPWATESGGLPSALQGSDPLPWRNWHVSFSRTGAGFAHLIDEPGGSTNLNRRDDLSTVYVDLIALEMLKDRVVQGFAEVTRDLATETRPDREFREKCMTTWKALVRFASQYFVRTAGISVRDRDVVEGFRQGVWIDLDRELARVQDNLERLAEVSRIELEEERNTLEAERNSREAERNQRERDFNRVVGVLATVFIPLSVVPPLVEWFVPLPSRSAWGIGVPFILVIVACVAVPLVWNWRKRKD